MNTEVENPTVSSTGEFEREPVPARQLKGWKSFIGMYAGEHTAGTEFVIGPLFVAAGASAFDMVVGLLVGNFLAVLSWAFLTAPIATKTRLTLYYQLEKIGGKNFTLVYNLVNGLMFCFLAGAMITVSATAVGIPFNLAMPSLTDIYPTSIGWVITVLIVGLITTFVAMYGYNLVSKFANIAAPWMILIFIAAALVVLPQLGVQSVGDFWNAAESKIWTGVPLPGQTKFTIWHVIFFSWFTNMAMHIGMADMTILRYAKKWQMGFSSAAGMFVGHYIAWLAAGILFSVALVQVVPDGMNVRDFLLTATSADLPSPAPGPLAYNAVGFAGALCVVIAGWTTANPTLYRAGLAVQSVMPKAHVKTVTFFVGLVTTIAALFPALVMRLLDFVALYGLILMPIGAVIFFDVQVFPKIGLVSNYAERRGIHFNWTVAAAWILTMVLALVINLVADVQIYFLGLPGWFIAVILYVVFSWIWQKRGQKHSVAV